MRTDSAWSAGRHSALNGRLVGVVFAREQAQDKVVERGETAGQWEEGDFSLSNKKKRDCGSLTILVLFLVRNNVFRHGRCVCTFWGSSDLV